MDLALRHRFDIWKKKYIHALETCTNMHVEQISGITHNGFAHSSLKVGPYQGQKWLFRAMNGSPTMDVLTNHGYSMNSKRQNKVTQSVFAPCTP